MVLIHYDQMGIMNSQVCIRFNGRILLLWSSACNIFEKSHPVPSHLFIELIDLYTICNEDFVHMVMLQGSPKTPSCMSSQSCLISRTKWNLHCFLWESKCLFLVLLQI